MKLLVRLWRRPMCRLTVTSFLLLTLIMGAMTVFHLFPKTQAASNSCQLNSAQGKIQHVIYIQFDNTHFTRDNPNVPSDLEQMPHLLNFIENNGTMLSNNDTPLIAHTANDSLTNYTGLYGDRHGTGISNSYRYFTPTGTANLANSFIYW